MCFVSSYCYWHCHEAVHPFASFTVPHALLAKLSLCASMEPDTTFSAAHPLAPRHDWPSFIPQLIRDCTHKGWALGGQRFQAEIEALGRRQAASRGVGRPRKQASDRD